MFFFFFQYLETQLSQKQELHSLSPLAADRKSHLPLPTILLHPKKFQHLLQSNDNTAKHRSRGFCDWMVVDRLLPPPTLPLFQNPPKKKKKKKVIRYGEDILKSHFWFFCYCVVSLLCQSSSTSFICSFIYLFIYFSIRQMTS